MSKTDLPNEASTNHGSRDLGERYSRNPGQDLFDREFNSLATNDTFNDIANNLGDVEQRGNQIINDNADTKKNKAGQEKDLFRKNEQASKSTPAKRKIISKATFRGKSAIITAVIALFGGGGALTLFLAPAPLAMLQIPEILKKDLNDQVRAFDKRQDILIRAKYTKVTKGGLIAKRWGTMTDAQAERFRAAGYVVDRDMTKGFGDKRGQVKSITFTNPDTGEKKFLGTAREFEQFTNSNTAALTAKIKAGFNAGFTSLTDKVATKVNLKNKITKTPQAVGDTDEERQNNLNKSLATGEDVKANNIRPQTDDENKPNGKYIDEYGNEVSQAEQDQAARFSQVGEAVKGVSSANVLSNAAKFGSVIGAGENVCTAYNGMRAAGTAMQLAGSAQLQRTFVNVSSVPDAARAGDGNGGTIEFMAKLISDTDTRDQVVDESKMADDGTAKNIPMIDNPDKGKATMDSEGIKLAQSGEVPQQLSTRASRFSQGGSFSGGFSSVTQLIARVVNGGNPDPRQISKKCKLIQNNFVRIGGLALGILAGVGSFGISTAFGIGSSLAVSTVLPFVLTKVADIYSGDLVKNISGVDLGNAAFVGASLYFGAMALNSGLKPLSAQEAVAYTAENNKTNEKYATAERYMARATPFDITNQFSFLGSLSRTIAPFARQSATSVSSTIFSLASLVPASLSFGTQTAKADDSIQRFEQCKDPVLNSLGIGADVFCNVRYGLSEQELEMDPIDNAQWMIDTGNIDPNSETGDEKDNEQSWNYVKFLKECANRTAGWGDISDSDQSDGSACLSPENEEANKHFRIYTLDKRVNDALDNEDDGSLLPGSTGTPDGTSSKVGTDGWAFPTTTDAKITDGYKTTRKDHRGIDLAQTNALNKPIYAARGGTVIMAGPASGYGNWIVIKHDNNTYSIYGHMFNDGVLVRRGDTVTAGQQIGKIGWNGSVSPQNASGSHLHFEIWDSSPLSPSCTRNGRVENIDCSIDPTDIVNKARDSRAP